MTRIFGTLLIALTAGACQHNQTATGNEKTLVQYIREAGYTDLAFPTTAYSPGALVTYESQSPRDQKLRLRYICSPNAMSIPEPTVDRGQSQILGAALGGEFKLQGLQLSSLGLGGAASKIDNVSLRLKNVQALEQSYEAKLEISSQVLGPYCTKALAKFKRQSLAFQTAKALRADVEYEVNFKSDVSAEAKAPVLAQIALSLGGSISSSSTSTSQGTGLIYGVTIEPIETE
jgi:hypothetical protein